MTATPFTDHADVGDVLKFVVDLERVRGLARSLENRDQVLMRLYFECGALELDVYGVQNDDVWALTGVIKQVVSSLDDVAGAVSGFAGIPIKAVAFCVWPEEVEPIGVDDAGTVEAVDEPGFKAVKLFLANSAPVLGGENIHPIKLHTMSGVQGGGAGPQKNFTPTEPEWSYADGSSIPRRLWGSKADPAFPNMSGGIRDEWRENYLELVFQDTYRRAARTFLNEEEWTPLVRVAFAVPSSGWGLQTLPYRGNPLGVQARFPKNLTRQQNDVDKHGDPFFIERLLNGTHPAHFQLNEEGPVSDATKALKIEYTWDKLDFDGPYELPNATAFFERSNDGLKLTGITLKYRRFNVWTAQELADAGDDGFEDARDYSPTDAPHLWRHAKYVFRVCHLLAGEIDMHLCRGHLLAEQYLLALMLNVASTNPLHKLLIPHLRQADRINHFGSPVIFGKNGILAQNSALTPDAVTQRFQRQLGGADWKGWSPRQPVCRQDRYAQAANKYWELVKAHVEAFFKQHGAQIADLDAQWRNFGTALVNHAVEYQPFMGVGRERWWSHQEMPLETYLGEVRHSGQGAALHPINDMDDLQQLCAYAIFHASFFHSWTHNAQYDDGGDITYAALGLRRREPPASAQPSELEAWWSAAMPAISEVCYQLFVSHTLTRLGRGYLTQRLAGIDDEDVKTMAPLAKAVRGEAQSFALLGLNINKLRSRVDT